MRCRHCHKAPATRPRGLCWNCYYVPGVRDFYPSKFVAPDHRMHKAPLPPEPTQAEPGSPEKVAVLQHRQMLRYQLHHPADLRIGY